MTGAAQGQNKTLPRNSQFWFDYDPTRSLSKRWTLDVDAAARYINSDPAIWQILLYPTLEFSLLKWMDLTGGCLVHLYQERILKITLLENATV
jgi:hypothetical protein